MSNAVRRLAILTRHAYPNYGSLLQAYALQTFLTGIGALAPIVDYIPEGEVGVGLVRSSMKESRLNSSFFGRLFYRLIQAPNYFLMSTRFASFRRAVLTTTRTVHSQMEVLAQAENFDAVIVGSDQVWNRVHGEIDPSYFLESLDSSVERASYAASLGSSGEDNAYLTSLVQRVQQFDHISFREVDARRKLSELGVEGRVDVDPVLLLDRQRWSRFAGPSVTSSSRALVYQLHNDSVGFRKRDLDALCGGMKRDRIVVDSKMLRDRSSRPRYLPRPETFVSMFRDSGLVVTDSFHGTVFSMLFGTPVVVCPPLRGANRVRSLLSSYATSVTNEALCSGAGKVLRVGELDGSALERDRRLSFAYLEDLSNGK